MFRSFVTAAFVVASMGIASAQMAPPPGAVTHQGTKTLPSPKASHKMTGSKKSMGSMNSKKSMGSSSMHSMKASPKP